MSECSAVKGCKGTPVVRIKATPNSHMEPPVQFICEAHRPCLETVKHQIVIEEIEAEEGEGE